MKTNVLCFLFFLIALHSKAQFKEGYIITNDNDTVSGYINYKGPVKNTFTCEFAKTPEAKVETYTPGDIKAFRFIDSKYFTSDQIEIDSILTPVFLEWLIMGEASILSFTPSDLKIRYFIKTQNDSLIELKNTTVTKEIYGHRYEVDNHEYIGQLKIQLQDKPELFDEIERTPFQAKSLIKVSKKYHNLKCPDEDCLIFEDKNRKYSIYIAPSVSFIASQYILNNGNEEAVKLAMSPGYGINIKFGKSPVLSPKFSFNLGASFYDITYEYDAFVSNVEDYTIARIKYVRIPLTVSYKILNKQFSPYFNTGLTANYRFNYQYYDTWLLNEITNQNTYNYDDFDLDMKALQIGFNAGIGFAMDVNNKWSVDFLCSYEYLFRFFGGSVSEKSHLNNLVTSISVYYRLK